jgi:hypothetical protein
MRYWQTKKTHGKPLAGIAVACFLEEKRQHYALACLIKSFQAQTYDRWRLLLVHDGPLDTQVHQQLDESDDRVDVWVMPERKKQFGHPYRQMAIDRLLKNGCTHIGLTNQDNYYAPVYLEWLLSVSTNPKRPRDLVYCNLVHSHKLWQPFTTEPRRGKLDLGSFLITASLAKQVQFDNFSFNGDGAYIDRLRVKAKGIEKVSATLMVHN